MNTLYTLLIIVAHSHGVSVTYLPVKYHNAEMCETAGKETVQRWKEKVRWINIEFICVPGVRQWQ